LSSENLIENIAALFDDDRGLLIEKNTVFTNWLFNICLKRKEMNNTFDNELSNDN